MWGWFEERVSGSRKGESGGRQGQEEGMRGRVMKVKLSVFVCLCFCVFGKRRREKAKHKRLKVAGTSMTLCTRLHVQGDSFSTSVVSHVQHNTPTGMIQQIQTHTGCTTKSLKQVPQTNV